MGNILTSPLPVEVQVGGHSTPVVTDFRAALLTLMAFETNDLTPLEKQSVLLTNLFVGTPADWLDWEEWTKQAVWFLNCGEEPKEDDGDVRTYSFTKDAQLIFAAFRQTHGIDLQVAKLHWWEFKALFMDLGSDTTFCQLVSLRRRVFTNKATKEEQALADELGDVFDVPTVDNRTSAEKDKSDEFMNLVKKGQQQREAIV